MRIVACEIFRQEPPAPLGSKKREKPGACYSFRRSGSLSAAEARLVGLGSAIAKKAACDGCGLCTVRCPQGVLEQSTRVALDVVDPVVVLTSTSTARCPCGAAVG